MTVAVVAAALLASWCALRTYTQHSRIRHGGSRFGEAPETLEDLFALRLARGDISTHQYERAMADLMATLRPWHLQRPVVAHRRRP
jgi:uncharacterized membrane protein